MQAEWMLPIVAVASAAQAQPAAVTPAYVEAELNRLATDYAQDPFLIDVTFGVEVDGNVWTVDATPGSNSQPGTVTVTRGSPTVPTWVDGMSGATFRNIVERRISALTASVRASRAEVTLMNPRMVNGMSHDAVDESGHDRSVLAHFWTTGQPEMVPFGLEGSKEAHGAQASVLHYDNQLRSAWFGILPGQHVNRNPADQANPFPSMYIIQRAGSARARIGGREVQLR
ncbi:MAG: hypothetical protein AB7H79_03600, partial [Sphingomonas sp.]